MGASQRDSWSRRLGFVLAASGSAIGLGNLWRFPTVVGENGGAAFVLVYIVGVIVVAFPILLAELAFGRRSQRSPVGAYARLRSGPLFRGGGLLNVVTALAILAYYSVVASWCIGYLIETLTGAFTVIESQEQVESVYEDLLRDPLAAMGLLAAFVLLTRGAVVGGVQAGIERWSRVLMPALLALLGLLVVRSLTLDGAESGLTFFLEPDFSRVGGDTVLSALSQAFFSIGVGMGIMITYGSYLTEDQDPVSSSAWICGLDTGIALLAGLAIFPALFTVPGLTPTEGPRLVFVVLPNIFAAIPGGQVFGVGFFALLTLAAVTSAISLMEVQVAFLIDEKGWLRRRAVRWVCIATFCLGVPVALSQGGVSWLTEIPGLSLSALDVMDVVFGKICVCLGALFASLSVGWVWRESRAALGERFRGFAGVWSFTLRFVCPVAILLLLISGLVEWL